MKFLCDVHISIKLVKYLISKNHDCIHVNTILEKWHTKDRDIANYADQNGLILITKDGDFRDSHYLKNTPNKLVKINLGNISNTDLILIIGNNLTKIEKLNSNDSFILEVGNDNLIYSLMKIVN
jgi:predicted nuclease of predicted toxin-antitoxin system